MAIMKFYKTVDMFTEKVAPVAITTVTPSRIGSEIGDYRMMYEGDFQFDVYGNITGDITRYSEFSGDDPIYDFRGFSVDAFQFFLKIAGGEAEPGYRYILQGADRLQGSKGTDKVSGFEGNDKILGGGGRDTMYGGEGHDKVMGQSGNDRLFGESGNDKLVGGGGKDILDGGAGNDTIKGGGGADTFIFDRGSDKLVGGGGRDTVEFDGAFNDYDVSFGKKVVVTFEDDRDVLIGMERLEFDDVTLLRQGTEWIEVG